MLVQFGLRLTWTVPPLTPVVEASMVEAESVDKGGCGRRWRVAVVTVLRVVELTGMEVTNKTVIVGYGRGSSDTLPETMANMRIATSKSTVEAAAREKDEQRDTAMPPAAFQISQIVICVMKKKI